MAKCKWCECDAELNRHGYCENCNASVREDIKAHIAALTELTEQAAPFLPDDEKTAIHKTMLEEYEILKGYKAKKVPFFKSDIEVIRANVIKKLGMEAETVIAPPMATAGKKYGTKIAIAFTVVICALVLFIFYSALEKGNDKDKRSMVIQAAQQCVTAQFYNSSTVKLGTTDEIYEITKERKNIYSVKSWCDAEGKSGKKGFYSFLVKLEINFKEKTYNELDTTITFENYLPFIATYKVLTKTNITTPNKTGWAFRVIIDETVTDEDLLDVFSYTDMRMTDNVIVWFFKSEESVGIGPYDVAKVERIKDNAPVLTRAPLGWVH